MKNLIQLRLEYPAKQIQQAAFGIEGAAHQLERLTEEMNCNYKVGALVAAVLALAELIYNTSDQILMMDDDLPAALAG